MTRRAASLLGAMLLVAGSMALSRMLSGIPLVLFGAGVVGLLGIAADNFLYRPTEEDPAFDPQTLTLWTSPGLLVAAGLWVAQVTPEGVQTPLVLGVTFMAGALLLGLQGSVMVDEERLYRWGRFAVNLILYLAAFALFALIYQTRERSLFTATGAGLVALLAGLELFRSSEEASSVVLKLALLGALIVAEAAWVVNYWPVGGLAGGALLLLSFYVFAGLLQAVQEGGLDRRVVIEYGSVGAVGLMAISWALP